MSPEIRVLRLSEAIMTYAEKLKDPRWQRKRLEIFQRDDFKCIWCKDSTKTLHVHHLKYERKNEPWDYNNEYLVTVCEYCHEIETNFRKESERELLEILALKRFSQYDLQLLCSYIYDNSEQLKTISNEYDASLFREDVDAIL